MEGIGFDSSDKYWEVTHMSAFTFTSAQKQALDAGFSAAFGGSPERYFSAPGRTEIGGNHTDHQPLTWILRLLSV